MLANFWPRCQGRSQPGSTARGVLYMEHNAMGASLWPSSVIKTGVSLAAHKARYFATLPNLLASPGYPLFPSASSVSSCVLSVCRNRRPLHTRSLARSAACLLPLLFSLCRQRTACERHSHRQHTPPLWILLCLFSLLRTSSTFRSGVMLCFLSREQRCEVYLNLCSSFFSFSSRL